MYTYGDMNKILGQLEGRKPRLEPSPLENQQTSIEIDLGELDQELALR